MLLRALAPSLLLLAGCPKPDQCQQPFFGDATQPMQIQPVLDVVMGTTAKLIDVSDGDAVDLLPPPQGGFGVFAGARAKNLDPCDAQVRGRLRDPATMQIIKENARTVDLAADGSGWLSPTAASSFANVANIVACPDELGAGVADRALLLEVTLTDRGGRSATVTRTVTARCPQDACHDECQCVCGPGYFAGKCAPDGGVPPDGGACFR